VVQVKICGVTRREDAEAAVRYGADFIGINFEPTSPRYVGDRAPDWVSELGGVHWVAVFGPYRPQVNVTCFDDVQASEWGASPRPARRIEVVRLRPGAKDLPIIGTDAQTVLLDAWNDRAYGGTGESVDLAQAAELVRLISKPVILAGGLTPENVASAIRQVRPFAVDVSSGVEASKGIKDPAKIRDFIAAAKGA
jgi:phosphoribosylanthranilate isomerase